MFALQILLVDDDDGSRNALARLLNASGFGVHEVSTVADAIDAVDELPIDLLITESLLPDGNGSELMRRVQERTEIPAIALSGEDQSQAAGFFARLLKPVDFQQLLSAIHAASPVVCDGLCRCQSEVWIG